MKTASLDERRALGAFLRKRRPRLQPNEVGMPARKRRTPELRRDDVATLAGMSVSWYTWLEQGRNIRVSVAALERLAVVLRLDRVETAHLFALASRQPPLSPTVVEPSDGLIELVSSIDPVPAYVRNTRLDILAWNSAITALFVDFDELPASERNTLRLTFLYPPYRSLIRDWEHFARGMLRVFRGARGKASNKAPFDALIEEISAQSEELRTWWTDDDVQSFDEGIKRLRHPTLGSVDLTYLALVPEGQPELSLVTYLVRPAGRD